jgi:hypothetical protein
MSRPLICYISGPMTGIEEYNIPAFNRAEKLLRQKGYAVINVAMFGADPKKEWRDYLARDLALLPLCDIVVTLPGWKKSKGASLEIHVARELGMEIIKLRTALKRKLQIHA